MNANGQRVVGIWLSSLREERGRKHGAQDFPEKAKLLYG